MLDDGRRRAAKGTTLDMRGIGYDFFVRSLRTVYHLPS